MVLANITACACAELWKLLLKCYCDQIFTPWIFRYTTQNSRKDLKRRLPFLNICIGSGDIWVWKMYKICKWEDWWRHTRNPILHEVRGRYNEETKFSVTPTKLGVTENFVSSLYLPLIQSSTLKSVLSTVLTALATLLHVLHEVYK